MATITVKVYDAFGEELDKFYVSDRVKAGNDLIDTRDGDSWVKYSLWAFIKHSLNIVKAREVRSEES
jgi:hypothetical protein